MDNIKRLKDFDLNDKKVLLRVDLNVPIIHGKIVDHSRIERIIPTVKYLAEKKAKIILISHFGRPKGEFNLEMSLAPMVDALNKFLPNINFKFSVDCLGQETKEAVKNLKKSEVLLLENLRFYPGEEKNDPEFAKELANFADIYVNDTFSCSHRDHASITGLAKLLPSAIGLLFEQEITSISKILKAPKSPVMAIIGGSKVSTKLELLNNLVETTDKIVIGGGMANSFLKAQNIEIGKSLYENNLLDHAKKILKKAKEHNCKIILPIDAVTAKDINSGNKSLVVSIENIPKDQMILDIGPLSCINIIEEIKSSKTLIWNGPVGAFEFKPFNISTENIARAVALFTEQNKLISIAGGGDIVASLKASGIKDSFTYLSTAGGAFLQWLEGKTIIGMKALIENNSKAA